MSHTSRGIRGELISRENYQFLQEHIYRESGIVLDDEKHYLLEARLMPIAARRHLATLNELCDVLRAQDQRPLRCEVVEAMTTNETMFFRDIEVWNALQTMVIPDLIKQHHTNRTLSLWSAATASGQEAYSLAMLLLEFGLTSWDLRIVGTDLSEQMLTRARAGRYTQLEVNRGLPVQYLLKYFEHRGLEWHIKEHVRNMVRFERADLRSGLRSSGQFDLVLCRNVMIYFDVATKRRILRAIRGVLSRRGYLVLGSAETTLNLDNTWERRSSGRTTFYQTP